MKAEITFQKQTLPYEAEPNTANPSVEIADHDIVLSFPLKGSDKIGRIAFRSCMIFSVGDPNDEGFFGFGFDPRIKNSSIYSQKAFPDLEWGYFYKVSGINWKNTPLASGTVVSSGMHQDVKDLSRFIFFMKDGTFECIAKSYEILS